MSQDINGPGDPVPQQVPRVPVGTVRRAPVRRNRGWTVAAVACALGGIALFGAAVLLENEPVAEAATGVSTGPALSTSLVSARRVPRWTTAPVARRELAAAVQPVADAAPPGTCIGVGDGATTLYAHSTTAPLQPASNQKLLTAAAAIDILGPETTLDTEFRATGAPLGGVLTGNLHMVGGGDPLLTTEAYQSRQRRGRLPETDLEAVADQLVAAGIRRIDGSVVGDASRYDDLRSVEGWPSRWLSNNTVAPLAALMVNDAWLIDPTNGGGAGGSAEDPAAHAAGVLTQLLVERGVVVTGPPTSGPPPEDTTALLTVPSLPVAGLADEVLRFSDNTTAELLVKEIGVVAGGEGSTAAGAVAITEWATANGYPTGGMVVGDGSGLAPSNRMTCDLLAAILRADGPDGPVAAGLAVPGDTGTLSDRFEGQEWTDRLRAKTGTLNEVTALSGWLASRPGATLDFEIVTNTEGRRVNSEDVDLQARLLTALLDQPRIPPVDQAGPLPPRGA